MARSIECTFITTIILLLCSPCFASGNSQYAFNSDYFKIDLPVNIRQLNGGKVEDNKNFTYAFMETNKVRKKSILLVISMNKIDNSVSGYQKDTALKDISKYLRDIIAGRSDCKNHTTGLVGTRISGQESYYFERRSRNCVVIFEKYWVTIKGNHAFTFYLARPVKGDNAVFKSIEGEILKAKLK